MRTQVRLAVFRRADSVFAGRLGLVGAGLAGGPDRVQSMGLAAAKKFGADVGLNLSPDEALDTPFLLIGTVGEIAAQLRERRDRLGFSCITVHEPYMATLAPVIEQLR